ncbi:MAG: ATP-dependent DNA helicase [Myxococcota bacterium]|nr:ATP-dependent DNA helicase [Myxococcota bacterium]
MLSTANQARDGGGHADALQRALARFGHVTLRPGQSELITDIFAGRPVIGVMPTGAGKSLCYQLPAIVFGDRGEVTLVVSPLIALMKDQVDSLTARGIPAVALTSAAGAEEQREILEGIKAGMYTIVYVAPERFRSPRFVEALRVLAGRLALIAIDEAHCISEWGHDFRPDYRRLGGVIKELAPARLAAFTATATPEVRRDIAVQLGMEQPRLHVRGFDRPNLYYSVVKAGGAADKSSQLADLVRMREGGVALVYAATRKNAEAYAADLKSSGMKVRVYHAGLEDNVREKNQDTFMAGKLDVIVATNAFGMGVDKSDIRLVVHADMPRSPEAYYQEAGRGGRDGMPTRCVLLFNHGDVRLQEFLIDASYPGADVLRALWKLLRDRPQLGELTPYENDLEARLRKHLGTLGYTINGAVMGAAIRILERHGMLRRDDERLAATRPEPGIYAVLDVESLQRRADVERSKLRTMVEYAYYTQCRRQMVLEYFGDEDWMQREKKCGACDNCDALAHGKQTGLSTAEQNSIRSLLLLVGALGGRFGRTRITSIALGTEDDPKFDDVVERGSLRGWKKEQVMDLLRALEGANLIEQSRGEYPTIKNTRRGDQVSVGRIDVNELGIQMPTVTKKSRAPRSKPGSGARFFKKR